MWYIITDDFVYSENETLKETLFGADILSGEEFSKCISSDSYYMIFTDIKAYPLGKDCIKIETLADFLESNREIVLLCTDSTFIEFYCKDRNILDQVYNNCLGDGFEEVKYVSITAASKRNLIAW